MTVTVYEGGVEFGTVLIPITQTDIDIICSVLYPFACVTFPILEKGNMVECIMKCDLIFIPF